MKPPCQNIKVVSNSIRRITKIIVMPAQRVGVQPGAVLPGL
jgi:hypothetical protein